RKVVGADAFGTIAGTDLPAPLGGARAVDAGALLVIELGAQQRHGAGAVLVLRTLLLHGDGDAARDMRDADRGFGLVDVLAAGAARTHGVDAQVGVIDDDVDLLGLRQHRD